jgi:hypothetical protein
LAKFIIFFAQFLMLCSQMTAGMIVRELWWTDQEFSSADIIPPWFSIFICHLVDEQ